MKEPLYGVLALFVLPPPNIGMSVKNLLTYPLGILIIEIVNFQLRIVTILMKPLETRLLLLVVELPLGYEGFDQFSPRSVTLARTLLH